MKIGSARSGGGTPLQYILHLSAALFGKVRRCWHGGFASAGGAHRAHLEGVFRSVGQVLNRRAQRRTGRGPHRLVRHLRQRGALRMAVTEFGETAAEQARRVLREIETAEGRIKSALSDRSTGLRITAGLTWMQAIMPEVFARFHDAYPDVELKLNAMTILEGIRLLVDGESDLHCGRIDAERYDPSSGLLLSLHLGVAPARSRE